MILWLCFTISGAAALALEMLWMRSAGLLLGQTAATTATVLACYFGGLGLGAAAARGVRQQPVRVYGWLELGAAAGALWSVDVFHVFSSDAAQQWLTAGGLAGRIAIVAAALAPATLCLGATLPALGQALAGPGTTRRRSGWLYALNTLGGVAGTAATGFGLPAAIGVRASYVAVAGTSALAGAIALIVGRRHSVSIAPSAMAGVTQPIASSHRLRIVAAGTGALALGLEVLWTRLFAQVLHNSVYSFSAIALVFLLAIAAGASVATLLMRRLPPLAIATAALITAAVATVAGVWLFVWRTDGLAYMGMQSGLGEYIVRIILLAAACVGPAAFASGAVLPALWQAWDGRDAAARPLGDLSAANTFGGVAGAVAVGFVAVPVLGVHGALLVAAIAYIVLADVLSPHPNNWRPFAYAALFIVVVANPMRAPLVHLRPDAETLHASIEGANGMVTVVETDGDLQLRLDNYYVLGGTAAATNERRLGLIPLLLHRAPQRVAFIGLATGITASAAPALGIRETTVVELVPEVAAAARTYFAAANGSLFDRPDVRVVLDDGRRYLVAAPGQFDVIVADLFVPWHAGAGSLYSREMYETVAQRLAPGGLFCQWLPLYQLTREEFDVIAHTFLTAFPHVSLWRADFYPNRPVVGLVGQLTFQPVDLTRVAERVERMPVWSRDPLLAAPRGLAMLSVGPLKPVSDIFNTAALNTDDRPVIEFTAPRLTRTNTAGDKDWFIGEALATFYDTVATRTTDAPEQLIPATASIMDAQRAGRLLFQYALAATADDAATAAQLQDEVRALVPEVIDSAESAEGVTDLAEARRTLNGLRAQQEQVRRHLEEVEQRLGQLSRSGEDRE